MHGMDVRIRSAVPIDLDQIQSLQHAALARTVGDHGLPPQQVPAACRCPAPILEEMVWSGRYLVAIDGHRVIGGAGWMPTGEDPGTGTLRAVFVVDPDLDRLGVGRRLVEQVENAIVMSGRSRILVPAEPGTVPFYRRLGYHADGTRLPCRVLAKTILDAGMPDRPEASAALAA